MGNRLKEELLFVTRSQIKNAVTSLCAHENMSITLLYKGLQEAAMFPIIEAQQTTEEFRHLSCTNQYYHINSG